MDSVGSMKRGWLHRLMIHLGLRAVHGVEGQTQAAGDGCPHDARKNEVYVKELDAWYRLCMRLVLALMPLLCADGFACCLQPSCTWPAPDMHGRAAQTRPGQAAREQT